VPSVEGARIPLNNTGSAPWRTTSRSSIESAPATIPATIEDTFAPAFDPAVVPSFTRSSASLGSPALWASRMTGTSPACDTRLGSSNFAETAAGLWDSRI
jgi:hypothetical protein